MKINKAIAIFLALLIVVNATPFFAALVQFSHGHHHQISTEIEADSVKLVFHHDAEEDASHHQTGDTHSDRETDSDAHHDHSLATGDHITFVSASSPTVTSSTAKLVKVDPVFIQTAITTILNEEFSVKASNIQPVEVYGASASADSVRTIVLLI